MKNAIQATEKILTVIQEMGYDAYEARELLLLAHNFLVLEEQFHAHDPSINPAALLSSTKKRSKQ